MTRTFSKGTLNETKKKLIIGSVTNEKDLKIKKKVNLKMGKLKVTR